MANDIIARIKEEGLSNFVKLIIQAGKETKKTGDEIDDLNDGIGKTGKSTKQAVRSINDLEKGLRDLRKQRDASFSKKKIQQFNKEIERTEKDIKSLKGETAKATSGFSKLGKVIGAAFATHQLIAFTKVLARTATEIDATNAKIQKVFGESAKMVERFAKSNATSLGLTVNEYKRAASAIGDLLIPIGFQRKEAANLSSELVNLSGALSAWTGGQLNATQVSDILTKALLGEREQLKQLGVQINEADVKSKLLEKGQSKLTGTMLAQAKASATLELIYEKTTDAQAAFSDDTKTLAEQQLELSANFRELKDRLATGLIPTLGVLLKALNKGTIAAGNFFDRLSGAKARNDFADSLSLMDDYDLAAQKVAKTIELNLLVAKGYSFAQQKARKRTEKQLELIAEEITLRKAVSVVIEDETKKTEGLTDAQIKAAKARRKLLNEIAQEIKEGLAAGSIDDTIELEITAKARLELEKAEDVRFQELIDKEMGDVDMELPPVDTSEADKSTDEYWENFVRKAEEAEAEVLAKRKAGFQGAEMLATGITSIVSQSFDAQLAALENKNAQGLISDKEYEKQRAELLTKKAKADKAAAIIQATISTAQGVAAQFQAGPAGPALAAIVAALGAAQIAIIASQPIPEFKEGVEGFEGGLAIVGDGGKQEPITNRKGDLLGLSPKRPTLVDLPKGANVFKDTDNYIKEMMSMGVPMQYNFSSLQDGLIMPNPSIDQIIKDKVKSEAVKGALSGINLNPLLMSNNSSKLYLGTKLDRIEQAIKTSTFKSRRND
ncbi:MAG: hypothetical protein GY756_26950 [bacterium]|nr:hypothetical protein [bacterium]